MLKNIKLKCIFVEDESPAIKLLQIYASKTPLLEVLGYFNNAIDAIDFLNDNHVDLLFSDVNMPDISGLEMIQSLRNQPHVVLITADPKYALNGYDIGVVDFLIKPIKFDRFMKAVNKVLNIIDNDFLLKERESKVDEDLSDDDFSISSIYVKENGKVVRVEYDEINIIEGLKDYVKIITLDEKTIITHITMKRLEEQVLPKLRFLRIHKSYIVCVDQIRKYDSLECMVELKNKYQIPVGPQYKDILVAKLNPIN